MGIGKTIKRIRISKNITQESLANAIGMSRPYIAKIEAEKHSISSERLTDILDYCNVNYDEFLFMINDFQLSEKMKMLKTVNQHYLKTKQKPIQEVKELLEEKYSQTNDIFYYHLWILCHCIQHHFDIAKVDASYIDSITDYLFDVNEWCYYELTLFTSFLFMINPKTSLMLSKRLISRAYTYKEMNSDQKLLSYLLFNLIYIAIDIKEYKYAENLLEQAKGYFNNGTSFFEETILLFYEGLLEILNHHLEGSIKCRKSLEIFQHLGHENYYDIYFSHYKKVTNLLIEY
ncbi:Rgg/GadR/MutR family transcriptional regulator [Paenibacillus sp. BR1-192]|uniref:helix-turn-helix domain-containing protein n=1 Tax=Paenibacillus sp. BR1-192 TaxID=3032287 RepID=UPI00240E6641|nr:Rgg/GadR/MutR family transcriptional regulator [Paenibacillus sp. BR1-192]WFB59843.1 helix-turn-helix domain-containing protein [Paenibacillus sp. BR1-192]